MEGHFSHHTRPRLSCSSSPASSPASHHFNFFIAVTLAIANSSSRTHIHHHDSHAHRLSQYWTDRLSLTFPSPLHALGSAVEAGSSVPTDTCTHARLLALLALVFSAARQSPEPILPFIHSTSSWFNITKTRPRKDSALPSRPSPAGRPVPGASFASPGRLRRQTCHLHLRLQLDATYFFVSTYLGL